MSSDSPSDDTRKVAELLKGSRLAMFTTIAADGTLISRPMALQEVEFDGDLWFFAEHTSRKVAHLAGDPQVNITVGSGSTWVSLTGTGSSVQDVQKQKDLWNAGVEAWFPQGPDSGDLVLIRVEAPPASACARGQGQA